MDYWWFVISEEKSILPALWLVIYVLFILYCIWYTAYFMHYRNFYTFGQVIEDCPADGQYESLRDPTVF